jgi:hypothetical protein
MPGRQNLDCKPFELSQPDDLHPLDLDPLDALLRLSQYMGK